MQHLLAEIRACTICKEKLPLGPNPILDCHEKSKIIVIGQAPGRVVHNSGIPWDDKSGSRLRTWLEVDNEQFYNSQNFGIIPMGFCYPGKGKSGDLPPQWHEKLFNKIEGSPLILLIGKYAQDYYLPKDKKISLTKKVESFEKYLPKFFVLPHPSPLNNRWMKKNQWFEEEIVPILRAEVRKRGVS